ncbi:MAG: type IV pilus assembly protein PilM [Planctomycetota bacterium]|nr:type IV pilus assembly protein PilM [Planctomycetota bacterium]
MFRRAKSIVGLDLGSSVVKAVEITLEGPEPVITGFGRAEIPPGGSVQDAVEQVFAENKFRSKRVCTGVSGQSTVVRYVPMLKMSDAELRQAIHFEVDKYLPFELDEVIMDCQALGRRAAAVINEEGAKEGDEGMTVLLAACRRELIDERIQAILKVGLTPVAVDLDLFALANAWELCGVPDDEVVDEEGMRASALVDVGATRTSINVLRGGVSCFSREINIGGADMTQAVARRLGVEGFEAEAIKRASETHEAEVNSAISPVLEDLASELSLSIDYVENHDGLQVEELLLSGGGVLAPGAAAYIEQATARPARTWNPLEGLRVDVNRVDVEELEAWAPSLVVAVGLAAKVRCE